MRQVTCVTSGCRLLSCPPFMEGMRRSHAKVGPPRARVSEAQQPAVPLLTLAGCVAGAKKPQTCVTLCHLDLGVACYCSHSAVL